MPVRIKETEKLIEEINKIIIKIFEIAQEIFENQQNIPEEVVATLPDLKSELESKLGSLVKELEKKIDLSIVDFPPLMGLITKIFILKIELPNQLKNSLSKLLNSFNNTSDAEEFREDIKKTLEMIHGNISDCNILGAGAEGGDEPDR